MERVPESAALSERVIAKISDAIVSGGLAPGDRPPPERKLAGRFGVSRAVEEIWNCQGYANNAWHRVSVRVGG